MPLSAGDKLGPYEILAPIGAGGMGEVYKARDTRLNRKWLAYTSDETRRDEIYVQTFPNPGGKWQVSTNGGRLPIWSWDGKELFFVGPDRKLIAVEVKSDLAKDVAKFEVSVPKALFETRLGDNVSLWYDVSKDGRFLIPAPIEQATNESMTVVVNWAAGLKK